MISQADGARLVAAHDKAARARADLREAMIGGPRAVPKDSEAALREKWKAAEAAFDELMSKLTESET